MELMEDDNASLSELDIYLTEKAAIDEDGFTVLSWWAQNAHRFLVVSRMERDLLAIPITSVPSECAFNNSSRVIDPFRSRLSTRVVQALICIQVWLKGSIIFYYVVAMVEDEELLQAEEDGKHF